MLRETAIIVRQEPFLTRPFSQSTVRISKFFRQIIKGISKLIFSVMSYMVGHLNNSRALKNTFLELSYKGVNLIVDWAQSTLATFTRGQFS